MKGKKLSWIWIALVMGTIGLAVAIIKAVPWTKRSWLMDILAMALLLGIYLIMVETFVAAFRHGDQVLVTVNTLGEKWAEALAFLIVGTFVLWRFLVILIRGFKNDA